MTRVISRVHLVHLMNVEQCQAAADPRTKPTNLGCESICWSYCQHPPSPFIITQPEKVRCSLVLNDGQK